jgi:hypothetical protein
MCSKNGPKNSKIYSFSGIFLKGLVQIGHIIACSMRLVNAFKEKITMNDLTLKILKNCRTKVVPNGYMHLLRLQATPA